MSTDDEHRREDADEFRDPTAPPPLPDPPDGPAHTQPSGVGTPPPFPPPGAAQPPRYEQPTYTQPTYGLPPYDQPPPTPYGAPPAGTPYGTPPAAPAPPPGGSGQTPPAPPAGNPYGSPAGPPPPTPYGAPAPGQYPYTAPPVGYGPPRSNTSAIILTVASGIALVACCGIFQLPALVLGIIALTRQTTDPAGSARMARRGWIAFGIGIGVMALLVLGYIALGVGGAFSGTVYPYGGF